MSLFSEACVGRLDAGHMLGTGVQCFDSRQTNMANVREKRKIMAEPRRPGIPAPGTGVASGLGWGLVWWGCEGGVSPDLAGAESAEEDEAACEQWERRTGSRTADRLSVPGVIGGHATPTLEAVCGLNQETDTKDHVSKEDSDIINHGIGMKQCQYMALFYVM